MTLDLGEYSRIEAVILLVVAPIITLGLLMVMAQVGRTLVSNLSARAVFRAKGYGLYQWVIINKQLGLITRIGIWSTHFLLVNCNGDMMKFLAVSNVRLDFQEVALPMSRPSHIKNEAVE